MIESYKVVVENLPPGGHTSRTTLVRRENETNWLYVTIGSASNVDNDYSRSKIMRYNVTDINKSVKKTSFFLIYIYSKSNCSSFK